MKISNYEKECVIKLRQDIGLSRRFGSNTSEKEKELETLENELVLRRLQSLNDDFIKNHQWQSVHTSELEKWDLVLYNDLVCKVEGVFATYYDAGSDTYNYAGTFKSLFTQDVFELKFDYYDQIKALLE
ncbi:MAG: hypothetical protein EAZ95_12740 [Bacteroidetes bacterium]|nr:MAG: hypothetical protein EAZ95_12740 [Bacteroidota bacterium]